MQHTLVLGSLALALFGTAVGCGGDEGEPLLAGTVTGTHESDPFTIANGIAATVDGQSIIGLGSSGELGCGSVDDNLPPSGYTAQINPPAFEVGEYTSVFVNILRYQSGDIVGSGSTTGTLSLSTVDAESVSGTIDFTHEDEDGTYSLTGDFTVVRCN